MDKTTASPLSSSRDSASMSAARPRLSTKRKLTFALIAFAILFVGMETVIRVGAYFIYNRSPYFLFYGFREAAADDNPEGHNVPYNGYAKFQPNRTLHQYGMFTQPTPIQINSVGLRGEEFSPTKSPGTFRVICMGESSTFGFFSRDHATYPAQLGRILNETPGQARSTEVINAGIPHSDSDNILAMLRHELLDYNPDVVTLYAGFNDSVRVMDETFVQATLRWLHAHVATYVAIKRAVTALGGPALHSRWSGYLSDVSPESARRQVQLHVERYERNLREMVKLAKARGIRFVVIKQPVVFEFDSKESDWRGVTFAARVDRARARLAANQTLAGHEASLVVHAALMDTLDRLSTELEVPIVDNIAITDKHPDYFASYVHLTEQANADLASAIAQVVAQYR